MSGPIDLFLVAGQSNAQGLGTSSLSPATVAGMAYQVSSTGVIAHLADPVGNASTGSAWPAFANALTEVSDVPMAVQPSAEGSSWLLPEFTTNPAKHWGPGSTLFSNSVARGLTAVSALSSSGWTPTLRGVLWSQGEADGSNGNADPLLGSKYQAAIIDLFDRYKTGLSAPQLAFYVFRTGANAAAATGFAAVRAAQDAACAATDGMYMVFTDAVNFPAYGYMADSFHYTQAGYNLMGASGGASVASLLYPDTVNRRRGAIAAL